jgi:flagellar motor switch/type III secretory pathway protein FliN
VNLPLAFPELAQVRQQQLDWCMNRITSLELSFDCLAKRVSEVDASHTSAVHTAHHRQPIGDFECQLLGLSSDSFSIWSEYWETVIQSAVQSISASIARDSQSIAGVSLPSASGAVSNHRFILTGTPSDSPVTLSISCKVGLGFKPLVKQDGTATEFKVKPLLEVGTTSIALERFDQMKLGGLLVLRSRVAEGTLSDARVFLTHPHHIFSASWNLEEGIILVTDRQPPLGEGAGNDSMPTDGIAIPIYAQLELQSVDLDQLKGLKEEDTLQAGVFPKDAIVKLSAGGVAFGEGLLVQMDGRLAVRITKLNRRSA